MEWIARHSCRIAVAVMIISFIASAALAVHEGPELRYPDENEYRILAANLIHQHRYTLDGVHLTASRPPGYAWFLSLPLLFGATNTELRLFNIGSYLICQLLLYFLARRIGSDFSAAVAMLMCLAYPVLAYTATLLYPQTVCAALLLCVAWILIDTMEMTSWRAFRAGTLCAMLILTIPTFVMPLAALSVRLAWKRRDFRRKAILFVAPMIVLIGGWSIRNYVIFRSFAFVSTNGGINLLIGNSEHSTMNSGVYTDISKYSNRVKQMSEFEADRFYKRSAVQWIKGHPSQALRLYGEKLIQYFSFFDRVATVDRTSPLLEPFWRRLLMFVTYEPLLILFIARLALAGKYPLSEAEVCVAILYVMGALFSAAFFPRIRFRLPMDWLLFVLDAGMVKIAASGFRLRAAPADFKLEHAVPLHINTSHE